MRVIIRCAGNGDRWGNYRGVPKHLVKLAGEPVLHRMVRLIGEIAPDADVKVVVNDMTDRRYLVPGSTRTRNVWTSEHGDIDKIASSRHLFDRSDRTVILWGDTWWSRPALTDVLTADLDGWHAWLRLGPHDIGGEIFAFAWTAATNAEISDACDKAIAAYQAGELDTAGYKGRRELRGGWALYRALCGVAWDDAGKHGFATVVDDWTEDMDTQRDWDEWCLRWAQTDPELRQQYIA